WIFRHALKQLLGNIATLCGLQFKLEQPLSDINYDIIRQVLREENDNHSQTAKRLGISRSTLWRILKNHDGNG
ncbi:MAG: sigma-54-dependent transcriptional regulator, partial [Lachnospiraceae bacterium]|nr:sigma-54-dependent transcriptional regulator [Lachnospiraceae bacterium]